MNASIDPNDYLENEPPQDLLSQIAAEDDQKEEKKDARPSVLMSLYVTMMRLAFVYDNFKRQNAFLFKAGAFLWGSFITVLYLGGVFALSLLVYSYSQFPAYIEDFFRRNNILVQHLEIPKYTFSRIELKNLEDKNGTYSIKSVKIDSTFSDFLQKRVRAVVMDGVTLKISEREGELNFGALPSVLLNLSQRRNNQSIKIDTLAITNAKIELEGRYFQLPVSFSLTGVYENTARLSIPFYIKEKDINVVGALSADGTDNNMTWTLEINSGTLTFPRRPPENISAKAVFETRNHMLFNFSGNLDLVYGRNSKKFNWNFKREQELFRGTLGASFVNSDMSDSTKDLKSNITASFDGVHFPNPYTVRSSAPIRVEVQSFYRPGVSLSHLTASLNGILDCANGGCFYVLGEGATVNLQDITFVRDMDTFRTTTPISFSFLPARGGEHSFAWEGDALSFDAALKDFVFEGYKNTKNFPISFKSGVLQAKGALQPEKHKWDVEVDVRDMAFSGTDQQLSQAHLKMFNVFDSEAPLQLEGMVQLKNSDVLKTPFMLQMQKKGLETKAVLSFINGKIRASFAGYSRLSSYQFSGNLYVEPFKLEDIGIPLDEVSSLFPSWISSPSGTVAILGQISSGAARRVAGPVYISLKDVGFVSGNMTVSGLNAVLAAETLIPFVTTGEQEIFVSSVDTILPFRNVKANIKMDSQFVRISDLHTDMGGVPVDSEPILLPYKMTNAILFLKNPSFDLALLNPALKSQGISLEGKGNLSLPLEMKNEKVSLKNGELKFLDATVSWTDEAQRPSFMSGSKQYLMRTGSLVLDTLDEGNLEGHMTATGRLMPLGEKKSLRDVFDVVVPPMPASLERQPVPTTILERQKAVAP